VLGGTISKYQFSSFILDTARCELTQSGAKVELEPQVYCMLELLVSKHLEIISRDDFINSVWDGRQVSNNTIDNRMKTVRAVIGDDGRRQKFIKTYPNRGYKFIGRVQAPRPHNADHMPQPGKASKIAVMPIEVIGEDRERPYLAKIIKI